MECIIAVDPGREKTGLALLQVDDVLVRKQIVPTEQVGMTVKQLIEEAQVKGLVIRCLVCGDGTNHKRVGKVLEQIGRDVARSSEKEIDDRSQVSEISLAQEKNMSKDIIYIDKDKAEGKDRAINNDVAKDIGRRVIPIPVTYINESYTTEEARKRYWKYTKRSGWRRFVPTGMQFPPEPIDDFTAWVIGERYLHSMLEGNR